MAIRYCGWFDKRAVAGFAALAFVGALQAAAIKLAAPEEGAVYDTHSPCVNEFLANFDKRGVKPPRPPLNDEEKKLKADAEAQGKTWYDRFGFSLFNDYTKDLNKRNQAEEKTWKPFAWTTDGALTGFRAEFSETADFAKPLVEILDEKETAAMRPKFLKLGTKYFWRVKAKDEGGKEIVSDVRSFTTADVPPRMIGIPSMNFRDVGGGTNVDGAKVRQGLLFRGMQPLIHKPTEVVKNFYVDNLGIKTDLDIRGETERAGALQGGEANLEELGLKYFCYPLEDYHLYHPRCTESIPKVMALLADRSNYPVYIHCMVGSDRTGTLFAVLDGVLGRDDKYVYTDYELPSFNEWLPRFRYGRKSAELFGYLDPAAPEFAAIRKEVWACKLDRGNIRANAEKYLLDIGVPQAHIDAFREIMLEK